MSATKFSRIICFIFSLSFLTSKFFSMTASMIGRNQVFVKSVSPLVDENMLKAEFSRVDEVNFVEFRNYPGSDRKFAVIDFQSSKGVTESSKLNGEQLMGVPMEIRYIASIFSL